MNTNNEITESTEIDRNNYIAESVEAAGFSSTYYRSEPDRLHEYTRQVVHRHLEEFFLVRWDLHGRDIFEQIQDYMKIKFGK